MELKNKIRKSAELGVSMTIIATLLAACGGGGGGTAAVTADNATINVTPALGRFENGATVIIKDKSGRECSRAKTANWFAAVTINKNTCTPPLIVQAGIKDDRYWDEKLNDFGTIFGVGIHAVLPDATRTSVGVTALTEIAAARLINASGVVTATSADVTSTNVAIANLISNGNVPDPLAVPEAAGSGVQATDAYGAVLATLANLAATGKNALDVAKDLAADIADGTWDGQASGIAVATPDSSIFSASMVVATTAASGVINAASAPTLSFASYVPATNIASAVAATASAVAASGGVTPITAAKNLFTSLRTSLELLTNPAQTGFFDTQLKTARDDLTNTVMPQYQSTLDKVGLIMDGRTLLDNLKTNGLPMCYFGPSSSSCWWGSAAVDPLIPGNTIVSFFSMQLLQGMYVPNNCSTTSHPSTQFSAGSLPTGIIVKCSTSNNIIYNANGSRIKYVFRANVTPAATANSYSFESFTRTVTYADPFDFVGTTVDDTARYSGTFSDGTTSTLVSGQLASADTNYAYDQVSLSRVRTYPSGTAPTGAPTGFALAKYDITGSIATHQTTGAALGTIALLAGSSYSTLEDANGMSPATQAASYLGRTGTLVLQARTANTQLDGTATASSFKCDLSGFSCNPANMSFTGSMTNLATTGVGKFAEGTVTVTRDFSAYNSTQLAGSSNFIKDTAVFSGTVITPAAVYQVTLNGDRTVYNQQAVAFIYKDASNNTVEVNATMGLASNAPYVMNVKAGSIIGVLTKAPSTGASSTSGLTGDVYVGTTDPINRIGTLTGSTINYTDGTFTSLQ